MLGTKCTIGDYAGGGAESIEGWLLDGKGCVLGPQPRVPEDFPSVHAAEYKICGGRGHPRGAHWGTPLHTDTEDRLIATYFIRPNVDLI